MHVEANALVEVVQAPGNLGAENKRAETVDVASGGEVEVSTRRDNDGPSKHLCQTTLPRN